jgi:hypothetical protein
MYKVANLLKDDESILKPFERYDDDHIRERNGLSPTSR